MARGIFSLVKYIMEFYENLFIYLTYLYWVLFVLNHAVGWNKAIYYFEYVSIFYQIFVAGILAILFNPLATPKLTKLRQRMVFTGATSLIFAITGNFIVWENRVKRIFK